MTEGRADLPQWREPGALIESGVLEASLGPSELRIVDCATRLKPAEPGDEAPYRVVLGQPEYDAAHIPSSDQHPILIDVASRAGGRRGCC